MQPALSAGKPFCTVRISISDFWLAENCLYGQFSSLVVMVKLKTGVGGRLIEIWNFGFIKRCDEGLALETPVFQIFDGDHFGFIKSFDKTKFSCFSLPPTQYHSFLRN